MQLHTARRHQPRQTPLQQQQLLLQRWRQQRGLPWVLQVDGHTDRRPISNARFPSHWELSTARALAIVKFLRGQGIPPQRLAATGYGEFHPLDARSTEEAYARNRRIELKLTSR